MKAILSNMTVEEDFDIPETGAIFTFGKSRFAENAPSKFWIKNDVICDVACGDEHTAILTGSGRLFTIGSNGHGQLGLQSKKSVSRPSCVKALKPDKIVRVACGRAHTLAASEKGNVYSWGHNGEGQLGTGDREDKYFPVKIYEFSGIPIQLSAGSSHSVLLTDSGEIYVWGSNSEGQLGFDSQEELVPHKIVMDVKNIAISCGYYHTLALTEAGDVLVWGEAEHGQLGIPHTLKKYHRYPQPVNVGERVTMVTAGSSHSVILTESGRLLTCGLGTNGQLGQGGKCTSQPELKLVEGVDNQRFIYVNSGDNHSAAISDDGLVYTWGCGRHGKLCQGEQNFSTQFSPILVHRLRHLTAVKVSCGGCHTMVLGYRRFEKEGPPLTLPTAWDAASTTSNSNNLQNLGRRSSIFSRVVQQATTISEEKQGESRRESVSRNSEPLESSPPCGKENELAEKSFNELEISPTNRNKALIGNKYSSLILLGSQSLFHVYNLVHNNSCENVNSLDAAVIFNEVYLASIFAQFFTAFRTKTPRTGYFSSEPKLAVAFEKTNIINPSLQASRKTSISHDSREKHEDEQELHEVKSTTNVTDSNEVEHVQSASREMEVIPQLEDIEGEIYPKEDTPETPNIGRKSSLTTPIGNQTKSRTCILL